MSFANVHAMNSVRQCGRRTIRKCTGADAHLCSCDQVARSSLASFFGSAGDVPKKGDLRSGPERGDNRREVEARRGIIQA